jgi:hypothetical protein
MLILWQDRAEAEAHAVAAASAADHSAVAQEEAVALVEDPLEVPTVAASVAPITVEASVGHTVVISEDTITIITTVHSSGDPDAVQYFMAVVVVSV